jgi:hypothetical protein
LSTNALSAPPEAEDYFQRENLLQDGQQAPADHEDLQ